MITKPALQQILKGTLWVERTGKKSDSMKVENTKLVKVNIFVKKSEFTKWEDGKYLKHEEVMNKEWVQL